MVLNKYLDEIPPEAVYIGRPSKWGNPFVLPKGGDREAILLQYIEWVFKQPKLIEEIKRELRGKPLVCFCAPKLCHGHVLEMIANE